MAALLKEQLGVSEVRLVSGNRGEFSVWVGDKVVAQKGPMGFPEEDEIVEDVREALSA